MVCLYKYLEIPLGFLFVDLYNIPVLSEKSSSHGRSALAQAENIHRLQGSLSPQKSQPG